MTELSRLIDRLGPSKNLGGFPGDQPSSVEELAAMVNRALDDPWGDREDDLTPAINADYNSGDDFFKRRDRGMELVGNRRSKVALVDLVTYLLKSHTETKERHGAGWGGHPVHYSS